MAHLFHHSDATVAAVDTKPVAMLEPVVAIEDRPAPRTRSEAGNAHGLGIPRAPSERNIAIRWPGCRVRTPLRQPQS